MGGPTIKRGESSGDIHTPWAFIAALESVFNLTLTVDLASSERVSAKAPVFITPEQDSLKWDWRQLYHDHRKSTHGALWLNPPYGNITPWARKCAASYVEDEQVEIFLLVPASVGANWFWDHVWEYATVYSVGRMVFDNCFDKQGNLVTTPYPKDLILCHYTNSSPSRTMQRWLWREALLLSGDRNYVDWRPLGNQQR